MRLCFVVQRYGHEVAGGSELHCRWLAGRLKQRHDVRVVTTCAVDYLSWANHYPAGRTEVDGVPVLRFPVRRERSERRFSLLSAIVLHGAHEPADELAWVRENGPDAPALSAAVASMTDVDLFVFYTFRYATTYFTLPRVARRAVLVPTAEDEPALHLPLFRETLTAPRGVLYLTPEEQDLVRRTVGNQDTPSAVVGSGLEIPAGWPDVDVRTRFSLPPRFLLYAGRIDRNKGADVLFAHYRRLHAEWPDVPPLVLAGRPALPIPDHPAIRHLGFVSEEEKFALLSACEVLVMPSAYESLSMVVLEAWAMGRPVLVNAACRVLQGQALRSDGGLFYRGYSEFAECLRALCGNPALARSLGTSGREYVEREYAWPVVEGRVEALLEQVRALG